MKQLKRVLSKVFPSVEMEPKKLFVTKEKIVSEYKLNEKLFRANPPNTIEKDEARDEMMRSLKFCSPIL